MTEWQDISTAPKDGTWILLLHGGFSLHDDIDGDHHPTITIGSWASDTYQEKQWLSDKTYTEFWDYGGYTGAGTSTYSVAVKPTHWMPLPEPPKDKTCTKT